MKRLLFFLKAYDLQRKLKLIKLLLFEKLNLIDYCHKWFDTDFIESRSLIGFIYDKGGQVKSLADGMLVELPFNSVMMRLHLRWNSSDFLVFNQIFIKEEYKCLTTLAKSNPVIVDAGANIGCVSVYLAAFYGQGFFIAIEPDAGNFAALKRNFALNNIGQYKLFNVAVWHKQGLVALTDNHRDKRQWSMQVAEIGKIKVESKTLGTLLAEAGAKSIDILKMDIEGAELNIFRHDEDLQQLLNGTKLIGIEVHDEDRIVENKLQKWGYRCIQSGETLFAER